VTADTALHEVDGLVDGFVANEPVPGVAYGVIAGGELIHTRGIGTSRLGEDVAPTADTVFRIASMTKSFTAATLLMLRDAGLLHLDDPAVAYVPELSSAPTITIRQLLTMSAGFPTDDPWGDRQQDLDLERFAAFLRGGQSFAWMPGTAFEYSNLGYGILGRVVTNVAGSEYRDVVRERVLEPLGLASTVYEAGDVPPEHLAIGYVRRDDAFVEVPFDGYGALAAMGGLFSTVRDLATWVDGFVRAFDDDDVAHPLARTSRLEMQQAQRTIRPELTWTSIADPPTASVAGYGFGLFVREDLELGTVIAHSGGYPGFGSHMRWHPASGLGVVILGNRTYLPALKVGERMLRALVRAEVAPSRMLRSAPALERARDAAERLLDSWDEDLAASTFSMNVALDEPLEMRRAQAERLRELHGPFRRSDEPAVHDSPFHASWWLEAERGRIKVEITLDPQPEPRVQWFDVTSVLEPDDRVRGAAERLVDAVNAEPPEGEAIVVRTLFGRCTLARPVASDAGGATYRVVGDRGELELAIAIQPETGDIGSTTWTPSVVRPPLLHVR
jgi:CubicO group peptidase (beta-lactamase class C family)